VGSRTCVQFNYESLLAELQNEEHVVDRDMAMAQTPVVLTFHHLPEAVEAVDMKLLWVALLLLLVWFGVRVVTRVVISYYHHLAWCFV
jgi:hypothetical protein